MIYVVLNSSFLWYGAWSCLKFAKSFFAPSLCITMAGISKFCPKIMLPFFSFVVWFKLLIKVLSWLKMVKICISLFNLHLNQIFIDLEDKMNNIWAKSGKSGHSGKYVQCALCCVQHGGLLRSPSNCGPRQHRRFDFFFIFLCLCSDSHSVKKC